MKNTDLDWETSYDELVKTQKQNVIIPNDRLHYLREISDAVRGYHKKSQVQEDFARKLFQLEGSIEIVKENAPDDVLVNSLQSLSGQCPGGINARIKTNSRKLGNIKRIICGRRIRHKSA